MGNIENVEVARQKHLIDNVAVSKEKFETFLATLTERAGTWYCKEQSDGGTIGYELTDKNGVIYIYKAVSRAKIHIQSLMRKDISTS